MEKLEAPEIPKPESLSKAELKTRPEIKVASLSEKGDPAKTYDETEKKLLNWLKKKGIKPAGPTLGVYYLDRDKVGVENVEWDACVPVSQAVEPEGKIRLQTLPETKVVSVTLTGAYDLIGPALRYLEAVSKAKGIKTKWPLTEIYHKVGEKPVTELQYLVEED